ncbi:FAD dependent oxidoreductase [Coniella lustricola]|uniref:FAD dependent oxidoreductase n=1 Tax=Coniella lustricola TaxID=2025994 RepID=A0A2T3A8E2_9PEZI|nr:FAD dependent oxidoreductase [Coniella lustricola]
MASSSNLDAQYQQTSGATVPVWVHKDKFANRPKFNPLTADTQADVCIIGAGIAGLSIAQQLVSRGKSVVLLEAREVLSGETGRTSGHLASALDDGYVEIENKHGREGAKAAADSHVWALRHVGQVAKKLDIDCEYRIVPGYQVSQYPRGDKGHDDEVKELKDEVKLAKELGLDVEFREGFAIKGWDGMIDQRDAAVFNGQAAFHPTLYLLGLLKWLKDQPNFQCFTNTRMMAAQEVGGIGSSLGFGDKTVEVKTEAGHIVRCDYAVEATNVPLQKLSVIVELAYFRTYAIAIRIPRGSVEDCFIYDQAALYKYVRMTACDDKDEYMIVGGCDHKVGQESAAGRYEELEAWTRERFPQAGSVDYKWSGQVVEPEDYVAFIGKNQGQDRVFIVTGDSGNGLTHGVLAGRLIADEIEGKGADSETALWATLYNPKRVLSIAKKAPSLIAHDVQVNLQYKRFLQSDIQDIEDLAPGSGGVLNPTLGKPVAVYKDENGKVTKLSALCPHLKGVVCWNGSEKSWDCPIHGSRFAQNGTCVMGPAKAGLQPVE